MGQSCRVDSIDWYYELRWRGPAVVLIPSGEGDCGSFDQVAATLEHDFTVLTFDMPGFSRSSPPPTFDRYSMSQAASEVAALVRSLGLSPATFYGCSSGGQIALCLAVEHASLVRNVAVHEVPLLPIAPMILALAALPDTAIPQICRDLFRNQMNENPEAWDALGDEYHRRLERNYVTWVRRYVEPPTCLRRFTVEVAWSPHHLDDWWVDTRGRLLRQRPARRLGRSSNQPVDVQAFSAGEHSRRAG